LASSAAAVSEAADVYSFGCLIFEVLEQTLPWSGLSEAKIVTLYVLCVSLSHLSKSV
jgi:hypothetical protein